MMSVDKCILFSKLIFQQNGSVRYRSIFFNKTGVSCVNILCNISSGRNRVEWSHTLFETPCIPLLGRGRGEDKNGRPIESGAINGGWHCSPRFQVKFTRIKNGAIVYRDWPLDFSCCTRFTRKIVSAFLLIHVRSTFYLDNCSLGNSIAGILLEAIQKKNEALYGNHILNIYIIILSMYWYLYSDLTSLWGDFLKWEKLG